MYTCDAFNCVVVGCARDGCSSRAGETTSTEEEDFRGSSGSSAMFSSCMSPVILGEGTGLTLFGRPIERSLACLTQSSGLG